MENILLLLFSGISLVYFVFVGLVIRQIHVTKGINHRIPFISFFALGIAVTFFIAAWVFFLSFVFVR